MKSGQGIRVEVVSTAQGFEATLEGSPARFLHDDEHRPRPLDPEAVEGGLAGHDRHGEFQHDPRLADLRRTLDGRDGRVHDQVLYEERRGAGVRLAQEIGGGLEPPFRAALAGLGARDAAAPSGTGATAPGGFFLKLCE